MTVEIDESTGLPVLPDGDFWRIALDELNGERVTLVSLRRKSPPGEWSEWQDDPLAIRGYGEKESRQVPAQRDLIEFILGQTPTLRQTRWRKGASVSVVDYTHVPVNARDEQIASAALSIAERQAKLGDYPPKRLQP